MLTQNVRQSNMLRLSAIEKEKKRKKETHNYLDFSKYFLYLYLKFCKVTELFRFSSKLFQI